jgi:hypothetical protein
LGSRAWAGGGLMTDYFWHYGDRETTDAEEAFDFWLIGSWTMANYVEVNEILDLFFIEDE